MRGEIVKLVEIVNRRSAATERKITALRKMQAHQCEAVRRLDIAVVLCESQLRRLGPFETGTASALQLQDSAIEGKGVEERLQDLRKNQSKFYAKLRLTSTQIQLYCSALAGLRRKVEYLRDREKSVRRLSLRREFARECAII